MIKRYFLDWETMRQDNNGGYVTFDDYVADIAYYKERACCDPANKWGHTNTCDINKLRYEKIIELEDVLETVWKFFHPTAHGRIDRVDMLDEIYYALLEAGRITFKADRGRAT